MSTNHEVISAFLDGEQFDSQELADALSEQSGRDLLIDLIALRHLAQPDGKATQAVANTRPGQVIRTFAAAAAVVVALFGGYVAGQRQAALPSAPPQATRVLEAPAAWHVSPAGGRQ